MSTTALYTIIADGEVEAEWLTHFKCPRLGNKIPAMWHYWYKKNFLAHAPDAIAVLIILYQPKMLLLCEVKCFQLDSVRLAFNNLLGL